MSASKSIREEFPHQRRTINVYEIWNWDAHDASKSKVEELPNRRRIFNVYKIWNSDSDKPYNIARTNVNRLPRRICMVVNAWLFRLGQLLIGNK